MMRYVLLLQLAIAVLFIVYKCVVSRDTFLRLHRTIVLCGIIFAFVYPLLQGLSPIAEVDAEAEYTAVLQTATVFSDVVRHADLPILLGWIYVAGVVLGCMYFLVCLLSLARLYCQSRKMVIDGVDVRIVRGETDPFSFFNVIFLPGRMVSSLALHDILLHERAHVRQGHTFDVLLGEFVLITGWFNPFAWLLRREIRLYTEFLADAETLNFTESRESYQYHLLQVSGNGSHLLGIPFNRHLLWQRIRMMNRCDSRPVCAVRYLLLLPVLAVLVFVSQACGSGTRSEHVCPAMSEESYEAVAQDSLMNDLYDSCEEMPSFPGGEKALLNFVYDNLRYPEQAMQDSVQGVVVVQFVVDATGKVSCSDILRSLSPDCDAEVLRVVRLMPLWTPGKENGKCVDVKYTMPIRFCLR